MELEILDKLVEDLFRNSFEIVKVVYDFESLSSWILFDRAIVSIAERTVFDLFTEVLNLLADCLDIMRVLLGQQLLPVLQPIRLVKQQSTAIFTNRLQNINGVFKKAYMKNG